jgi:hypothetical protein
VTYRPLAGALTGSRRPLLTHASPAEVLRLLLETEAVEVFGAPLLNTKCEPLAWHV